jgi:CBS domain-containing protein
MGFPRVYDYVAGKKDWGSWGLPHQGTGVPDRLAGDVVRRDVPTCALGDHLGAVRARVRAEGWDTCIVVNEQRIVLGRLGRKALGRDSGESVEQAMTPGPSTVRPSLGADALLERMRERDLTSFVVTLPNGRLVGIALRRDLE